MSDAPPLCPSCGQPASLSLADTDAGWECRNEACPEYGQPLRVDEPERPEPSAPDAPEASRDE